MSLLRTPSATRWPATQRELTSALSDPGLESPALCRLLLTALLALERKKREPALVKAAFELRVMAESGYAPRFNLVRRVRRGDREPAGVLFRSGGHSRGRKVRGESRRLCTACVDSTLRAMLHALTAEPNKVYAFVLSGPAREQFCGMAEEYVDTTSDENSRACGFIGHCRCR
ncbi:MAG: DNA repair protein RecO C-terminal domain-containing protein [Butyricicoccaceae bacterium]